MTAPDMIIRCVTNPGVTIRGVTIRGLSLRIGRIFVLFVVKIFFSEVHVFDPYAIVLFFLVSLCLGGKYYHFSRNFIGYYLL